MKLLSKIKLHVSLLTFNGVQKVFHSMFVKSKGLLVISSLIFVCSLRDDFYSFLQHHNQIQLYNRRTEGIISQGANGYKLGFSSSRLSVASLCDIQGNLPSKTPPEIQKAHSPLKCLRTFPQMKQNSPENEAKERDPLLINRN